MELIQTDVIMELVEYGGMALVIGAVTIITVELLAYGIVKALGFLRL